MVTLLLASASPARLATLRSAGIEPQVRVSHVDEDAVLAQATLREPGLTPGDAVLALAEAKAIAVARSLSHEPTNPAADLLIACDSMLEFDGNVIGKPASAQIAQARWRAMRGHHAVLHTGHWIMDLRPASAGNSDRSAGARGATASTVVHFANVSDAEIDAYVATGEPLQVAGGFTVDGLGGAFVTAIEGDYHNVVGISLPLVRELLEQLGVRWTDCWAA